jgi:hypothetical protein
MKYLFPLVTILFLFPLFSNAQSYYKPGYFINAHSDTVKGYIEYKEKYNNSKVFNFKSDLKKQPEKVSTADANAVGITGFDYFEKFVAPISNAYITLWRLTTTVDSSFTTDTVFLRLVKKGKNISLYSYTDNIKTRYYSVETVDKKVTELNYYLYINESDHSTVPVNTYRMQLMDLAAKYRQDNQKVIDKINNSQYDEYDLLKAIQMINGSTDTRLATKGTTAKQFFFGLGAQESKILFTGNTKGSFGSDVFYEGTSASSFSPTISGGIDFILNKETQKFIIRGEVSFNSANYKIDNQVVDYSGSISSLHFKQYTVNFGPQVIYNFYSGTKFKAFLNSGFVFNVSFYNKYSYNTQYNIGTSGYSTVNQKDNFPVFKHFWPQIPLKAGIVLNNRIEIYGRYWLPGTITSYTSFAVSQSAYQGGVNYLF